MRDIVNSLRPARMGRGWGGPNSDKGTDTLALCEYYNPSTGQMLSGALHTCPQVAVAWLEVALPPPLGLYPHHRNDTCCRVVLFYLLSLL